MADGQCDVENSQAIVEQLIVQGLREVVDEVDLQSLSIDGDTVLFGAQGIVDSVGLVSLVVAVEQAIADEFGMTVSLADEKALSQKQSPYRTVRALSEYANRVIQERA